MLFRSIGLKETIMVACWYIYWLRRRRTHDEEVPPVKRCMISILSITSNAKAVGKGRTEASSWIKPKPRYVKLNVDASFHVESGSGAVGAILRDYEGRFIAAESKFISHVGSVPEAEALAMKEGLNFACKKGCNNIIAESDSMETVEACSGRDAWHSAAAVIYADCMDLIPSLGSVKFRHISRDANKVAHDIARHSSSEKISCNWDDNPPSFILSPLLNDVIPI